MTTTLALLYGPRAENTLPALRNLVAHASRVRDPKFKERHERTLAEPYNRPKRVVGVQ